MSDINSRQLNEIIEKQNVNIVFQPIFDIKKQRVHGYEALTRGPKDSDLRSPLALFAMAERYGRLSELELICRKKAIDSFAAQELPGKLFLNVSPKVLLDDRHPNGETAQFLESRGLSSRRVVVEITEQHQVDDSMLKKASNHYRRLGFDIAIDDLGAGHSGLRQWSELMPDIVKVDRYFVENCHMDMVKKAFLKSIISLAKATNAQLIAEGIELEAEFKLLAQLGVSLCQGYLLEKPSESPTRFFPPHLIAPVNSTPKLFAVRRVGNNNAAAAIR